MNLLFRLVLVIVASLLRKRLAPMEESRVAFRVWPSDLDLNMHMTNARYFSVMDLGRLDLVVRSGMAGTMLRNRWRPVLGASTMRFRRPLKPFQRYEVVSRVLCWDDRWFYMEQRAETPQGTAAVAVMQGAFVGKGGIVAPAAMLREAGMPHESPPMPDFVASWRPQSLPVEQAA
ncbi:thioesterase family protein [Azospirillum sp. TSO22-1]|uniref:thioesterase family protein n=1 Tax=Azospirillum sp. TSO22-1 TaxID=716789 RepID=UPI000D60368B|nr:thioesterase family protein [Azospirillum sp. TSO22-1]PWC52360.1 thioesterase [Azospirillum sp. TSO22-1]